MVLLDSDNEILNDNWLSECKNIFSSHSNIAIVETDLYYSKNDNIYNRVCNLLRSSDVFVRYFTPNFLRQKVIVQERFYTKYKFVNKLSPAIASGNGVFFRKEFLNDKINFTGRFEETNYSSHLLSKGFYFAVLKNIYTRHNYVGSLREYIKKRIKIAKKFNARRAITQKTWVDSIPFTYKLFIVIYSLLIIGPILEAFVLSIIKKDWAIMVMPLLLFITTLIYIYFYFLNFIKINFKIFFDQ